jgi:hypothetical protein
MNANELRLTIQMLDMAINEFSNHSCNDLPLPNTPENMAFMVAAISELGDPESTPMVSSDGREIYANDVLVMVRCQTILRHELSEQRKDKMNETTN